MEWQRHQELLQKLDECNGALSSENASNDDGINGDQIMKQHSKLNEVNVHNQFMNVIYPSNSRKTAFIQ